MQAIFGSLDLIQKIKSQYAVEESICSVVKQWFYPLHTIRCHCLYYFGQVYEEQKNHLYIKNWIDGKVLSNLDSDNIKISTYCATDIDTISSLLRMEFIFKWPIIEKPSLATSEGQDAMGIRLYLQQYIWFFYHSS